MAIYQMIQEISTHDLYLKLATPLLGFRPTVKKIALLAMVTSQPLRRFGPTVNYIQYLP
jgi:hypothetical protein